MTEAVKNGENPSYTIYRKPKKSLKASKSITQSRIFKLSHTEKPVKLSTNIEKPFKLDLSNPFKAKNAYNILEIEDSSLPSRRSSIHSNRQISKFKEQIESEIYANQTETEEKSDSEESLPQPQTRKRSKAVRDVKSTMDSKVKMRERMLSKNLKDTYVKYGRQDTRDRPWMENVKMHINDPPLTCLSSLNRAFNIFLKGITLKKSYSTLLEYNEQLVLRISMQIYCGNKPFSQERHLFYKGNTENSNISINKRVNFDVNYSSLPNFASIITKIYLISYSSLGERSKHCIGWSNCKLFDHMCRLCTVTC